MNCELLQRYIRLKDMFQATLSKGINTGEDFDALKEMEGKIEAMHQVLIRQKIGRLCGN